MMETTSPVNSNITKPVVKLNRSTNRATSIRLTKGIKPVKDRTVFTNVEPLELADLILLSLGRNAAEKGDVVVGVEAAEVTVTGGERLEDLHVLEETVVSEESVRHADAVRLHGVALAVVVVPNLRVVEVAHFPLHTVWSRGQRVSSGVHQLKKKDYF